MKWKDLRRAGIEVRKRKGRNVSLTEKRIKARSEILEEILKKRDAQILNTKSMRDKLLAQCIVCY